MHYAASEAAALAAELDTAPPVVAPLTRETAWVIWSKKHNAFWGPNRTGYTTVSAYAGVYSEADALEIERNSRHGKPEHRSEAMPLSHLPLHTLQPLRPGTVTWLLTREEVPSWLAR